MTEVTDNLAALTFWYEFYYDVYPNQFQYLWKIKQLHEQYGPIVCINPIHIHIHDPDYFETIYTSGTHKRNRCSWCMHEGASSFGSGMLETMDHDLHKMRRSAGTSYFSKRSAQELAPSVVGKVFKLLDRLKNDTGKIVNLNDAMAALTMDVISGYCFGEAMGYLENPEYAKEWLDMLHGGIQIRPIGRQFPWLINTLLDLPPWIAVYLSPAAAIMGELHLGILRRIEKIRDEEASPDKLKATDHEKKPHRLMTEGQTFVAAGTETTARTLSVTTYSLLKSMDGREKLKEELWKGLPERTLPVSLPQWEALLYLSAVINEGLRVAHGVSSRQPLITTHEELQYEQWTIPRGTPVMESLYLIHMDPDISPEPFAFRPECWIENPKLTKYLFAFSRGSRGCLGMNLAISELYVAMAYLFRTLEMEIYNTVEARDVLTTNDCFVGMKDLKSDDMKVKVLGEVKG
ncbi:cytochrome P450 [Clohesyomyces aquaticus]|uniref:Cytochrome P450 n=1 Tax=Clohesyomyces aquaticus TaxID=1231657 RepID=A0A1Y2A3V3_9PLEO|nr:cytochrome P450 [Clohesyomyces aquaticus]